MQEKHPGRHTPKRQKRGGTTATESSKTHAACIRRCVFACCFKSSAGSPQQLATPRFTLPFLHSFGVILHCISVRPPWLSGVLSSCSFCPSSSCLVLFRAVWSVVGVCLACTSCRLSLKEPTRPSVFLVVCACSVSSIVTMLAALSTATKNVARGFAVARQSKHSSTRSGEGSRTSCFFLEEETCKSE